MIWGCFFLDKPLSIPLKVLKSQYFQGFFYLLVEKQRIFGFLYFLSPYQYTPLFGGLRFDFVHLEIFSNTAPWGHQPVYQELSPTIIVSTCRLLGKTFLWLKGWNSMETAWTICSVLDSVAELKVDSRTRFSCCDSSWAAGFTKKIMLDFLLASMADQVES